MREEHEEERQGIFCLKPSYSSSDVGCFVLRNKGLFQIEWIQHLSKVLCPKTVIGNFQTCSRYSNMRIMRSFMCYNL